MWSRYYNFLIYGSRITCCLSSTIPGKWNISTFPGGSIFLKGPEDNKVYILGYIFFLAYYEVCTGLTRSIFPTVVVKYALKYKLCYLKMVYVWNYFDCDLLHPLNLDFRVISLIDFFVVFGWPNVVFFFLLSQPLILLKKHVHVPTDQLYFSHNFYGCKF